MYKDLNDFVNNFELQMFSNFMMAVLFKKKLKFIYSEKATKFCEIFTLGHFRTKVR